MLAICLNLHFLETLTNSKDRNKLNPVVILKVIKVKKDVSINLNVKIIFMIIF